MSHDALVHDAVRLLRRVERSFNTGEDRGDEGRVSILREGLRCARDDLRFLAAAGRQLEDALDGDLASAFSRAEDRVGIALALYEFERDHVEELRELFGEGEPSETNGGAA